MNVVCIGMNHHTAPVEVRERFAVAEADLGRLAKQVRDMAGAEEAVIVSTCNRVEFYLAGASATAASHGVDQFLQAAFGNAHPEEVAIYRYDAPNSMAHLFRVVCGLDSMVLGETEILGQVKKAYQMASSDGHTSKLLNKAFQKAFQVAKQVRSRTGINRGAISVGSVAVELASKIFGNLASCKVLLMGAGENSERTARSLMSRGVTNLIVTNRSLERATQLADSLGGRAVALDAWQNELSDLDILITSTAATEPVVTRRDLEPSLVRRKHRPLFCIDIAVPRDIAADVDALENVYLYDIDSLEAIADKSLQARNDEREVCEHLIQTQVRAFQDWLDADTRRHGQLPPVTNSIHAST